MREILFRGKRKDIVEWIEGWYVPPVDYNGNHWDASISYKVESGHLEDVEVIPETVGQYTGLTDKNGKKIFEGDIVEIKIADLKKRGVVFYGERAARCGVVESNGTINYSFLQQSLVSMYGIRVVGNIHDNPDLLGGVKNAKKIKRLAYSQAGRL